MVSVKMSSMKGHDVAGATIDLTPRVVVESWILRSNSRSRTISRQRLGFDRVSPLWLSDLHSCRSSGNLIMSLLGDSRLLFRRGH